MPAEAGGRSTKPATPIASRPAGLRAFRAKLASRSSTYSYENRHADLPPRYLERLKANEKAWTFYSSQPPWYRRTATWWVISAKQEETRLRRLSNLIESSGRGQTIAPLKRPAKAK
jgi:uncharacterized protein YdeI (YjbR/CyaY-like superfamily)